MSTSPTSPALDALVRRLSGAGPLPEADERAVRGLPVTVRTVTAHRDIMHEGEPYPHCCIVLDGWTCCYQMLEGRRQIVSFHIQGELPDLQSLLLPEPNFGMSALTAARVAYVPHADLRRVMAVFPALGAALWRETLVTAAIHRAWMTGLGRRDARGRLAHLFCELHLRLRAAGLADDASCPLPLRQYDLADALGTTDVHINRVLQELRREGVVVLQGRRLEIRDWPALRAAAEFDARYLYLPVER